MKSMLIHASVAALLLAVAVSAQSADAYSDAGDSTSSVKTGGLFDKSRFSLHHALSFGAGMGGGSGLQSQGLYTTMLQYKFAAPLTVNLNFGFPLYSTFNSAANFSATNLKSADYFKNMPLDFALTWKPRDNMMMRLNVVRNPQPTMFSRSMMPFENDLIIQTR